MHCFSGCYNMQMVTQVVIAHTTPSVDAGVAKWRGVKARIAAKNMGVAMMEHPHILGQLHYTNQTSTY